MDIHLLPTFTYSYPFKGTFYSSPISWVSHQELVKIALSSLLHIIMGRQIKYVNYLNDIQISRSFYASNGWTRLCGSKSCSFEFSFHVVIKHSSVHKIFHEVIRNAAKREPCILFTARLIKCFIHCKACLG